MSAAANLSSGAARWPVGNRITNLWRVRGYLRPYYAQTAWLFAAAAAATGASIVVPLLVRRVVDGPVREHDPGGLVALGLLALLLGLVEALLIFIRRWVQSASALGIETALRRDLYAHVQRLPISFHDRWQSGQLLSRATNDLSVLRRFLSFGLIFLVINVATYVTVVILLLRLYWPLGLLVAVSALPLFVISRRLSTQYFAASRRLQDQQGDLATQVEESAQGIRVIRAFGRRDHVGRRFEVGARQLHDTGVGKATMLANSWSQFDLVPNATLSIVLVGGAFAVAKGQLSLGALVAFVSLQVMLVWPIDALGWIIANAQEAMSAADRIYEVLDRRPSIVDRPGAPRVEPAAVRGRVRFESVSFTYGGGGTGDDFTGDARGAAGDARGAAGDAAGGTARGEPVLRRVDVEVEPGETLAIVGATGTGKTTLVSLVPRLYDVTGGRITIDGVDVRDIRLDSLRRLVGVAFEDPTLFSMSVRENVALGQPDASDAAIAEALEIAQAQFVYELPWGLSTRVGEQGLSLSGGQRQRLALARAVLGRPRVLVLDDPLSALDVHTEALVEAALERVLTDTTALLVVHRPSTVALADRVALLQDGELTAIGTHSRLLAEVPGYRAVLSAADTGEPDAARQPAGEPEAAVRR